MTNHPTTGVLATDRARWRLDVNEGTHHWHYVSKEMSEQRPLSDAEKHFLGFEMDATGLPTPSSYLDAARNGFSFYQRLQLQDGHWGCDFSGPSFLLSGMILAMYITESEIPPEWSAEMVRYISRHVNKDGGWGMHTEGKSTLFATALYYVSLRILGMQPEHPLALKARKLILSLGGACGVPQWGKFWLAALNLYSWEGLNPVLPELWLLPDWIPFHPWRWWVQCRVVYLPVSYLYANRSAMPLNPLLVSLREEIYLQPYNSIDFRAHRNTVAVSDLTQPHTPILRLFTEVMNWWESYVRPTWIQRRADDLVRSLILREDENTSYGCVAAVSKAFHMVAVYFSDGPKSPRVARHREKIADFLWMGADGLTCCGSNGVQVWDTAFSVQAAAGAGIVQESAFKGAMERALGFLDMSQLRGDLQDPYRQPRSGGWPFSTRDNGYIVSDCAAEAMSSVILLQEECSGFGRVISDDRLHDCVDSLLLMQNADGGFASYEISRGPSVLELLNPAEVFDRVMVEYSYPECSAAVLKSLCRFHQHFPWYRAADIQTAVSRARDFILLSQRPDGSWYGSWAVCFTYAIWFSIEALAVVGETWGTNEGVRKACIWLLERQMADGGWGEHHTSCERKEYVAHEKSQVVNTAWSVMALMHAKYPDKRPIERGLQLILSRQQCNGEWLQEGIEGVFNRTCMIGYPNYKFYFTSWALGMYEATYLPMMKEVRTIELNSL
ncbi:MAG: hypothetical protein M1813_000379 [Trichoglossum hirsutum]|nr:MAG: hypothetical protein M1813_000379 [Trichoglossum hirsutum]